MEASVAIVLSFRGVNFAMSRQITFHGFLLSLHTLHSSECFSPCLVLGKSGETVPFDEFTKGLNKIWCGENHNFNVQKNRFKTSKMTEPLFSLYWMSILQSFLYVWPPSHEIPLVDFSRPLWMDIPTPKSAWLYDTFLFPFSFTCRLLQRWKSEEGPAWQQKLQRRIPTSSHQSTVLNGPLQQHSTEIMMVHGDRDVLALSLPELWS